MMPLADTHVHLLAGLDDGPQSLGEALAMCRKLESDGTRFATALAHQNPDYPENTADHLRDAAAVLVGELAKENIPLTVFPTGEVMLTETILDDLDAGRLQTVGGHGKFLLVEMPHHAFYDLRPIARDLAPRGLRLIVAHAERYPELLFDDALTDSFIAAGCLIQFTAGALADPWSGKVESAMKNAILRGAVHMLGSDGHGIDRRRPRMADGYHALVRWAGTATADRIAGLWGTAVLQGLPVNPPPPSVPKHRSWFGRIFGG